MQKLHITEMQRLTVEDFRETPKIPLVIVLDNVRSLHNVGSVFRTADAFLLEKIYLCGITSTPPNAEIHKTALGAEFSVAWEYAEDTIETVQHLKAQGFTLLAIEQVKGSTLLSDFQPAQGEKYAVILGNEVKGVQQSAIDLCAGCLEIPQFGTKHSLNVSVAAGIVIWDFFKKLKIRHLVVLFCLLCGALSAQKIPLDTAAYPFVQFEKNKLDIPENSDSALINAFFQKIDTLYRTGKGNINVLHIGGSHVQGGFFSEKIRKDMDFFNNGLQSSRGLIFPFKVAKTNNPTNFTVKYAGEWTAERNVKRTHKMPLGVAGIAVATADSNAQIIVRLNVAENARWQFDTLMLIGYSADDEAVTPMLKYNDTTFVAGIFDANKHTYTYLVPEKTDSFTVVFQHNDSKEHQFVVHGFLPKNSTQGIVYHDIGVNGAAVASYLNCENFEQELMLVKPDLVIFGIGINDAVDNNFSKDVFIDKYNQLIDKIRNVSPDCAFIFITNNDSYKTVRQAYTRKKRRRYKTVAVVNRNAEVAEAAFYELAQQHNGGVWNQFAIMGGLKSMAVWQNAGLAANDKIHFSKKGYELLGDLFFNALLEQYQKNKLRDN